MTKLTNREKGPFTVKCPKCGALPGDTCSTPGIIAHTARWREYDRVHPQLTSYQNEITMSRFFAVKKSKKVNNPNAKNRIPEGTSSGNCKKGLHGQCFSLRCICSCHKRGG